MLVTIHSCALLGLDTQLIDVEVDVSPGHPGFQVVGLGDAAVLEARERIRLAIKNCGYDYPYMRKIVANLAPADVRKEGAAFDLPMALGIILTGADRRPPLADAVIIGELSLDGSVRHTDGILPVVIAARERGFARVFVPWINAAEAALIDGIEIYPVRTLTELVRHVRGEERIAPAARTDRPGAAPDDLHDFAHIRGHYQAKRALEIAAAGGHNILFSGAPGSGKTLLARSFVSILPAMTEQEVLEVSKIYSAAGQLSLDRPIITERPLRAPHHSASGVALVGGGRIPKPGEITLAHRGVLFLDEFSEFPRKVLEVLRQPLEDGVVTVSRAAGSTEFPARFILIAAQNPCPCGYYGDRARACTCSPTGIMRYRQRVSGPLLDRIDLQVSVPRLDVSELQSPVPSEPSAAIRSRVEAARDLQRRRFHGTRTLYNAEMRPADIQNTCVLDAASAELLRQAAERLHFSGRSYSRILKVARTIADLAGEERIGAAHVAEAIQYRDAR